MNNNTRTTAKIRGLTIFFLLVINIFSTLLEETVQASNKNDLQFKKVNSNIIAGVGVALSTNIGTKHSQKLDTPANIYSEVMDISYILANKNTARDKIISTNMILLNEYLNVLKTDIKSVLSQSNDRAEALENLINQFEIRYTIARDNQKNIKLQIANLNSSLTIADKKLKSLKTKIGKDFSSFDTASTIENIDEYLKAKEEYEYAKTYIVFLQKFYTQYDSLNAYNKVLLDTLINNKEIIIKNTQLVLPDSGKAILQKLDLLYDEGEWKREKK